MAKASEFPVRYEGRAATLSWGRSAVRLFDRTSFALFKTFPDPTLLETRVEGDALVITDGIESIAVTPDGVAMDRIVDATGGSTRPLRSDGPFMPISTTGSIAGREIAATIGVVTGSSLVPVSAFEGVPRVSRGAISGQAEGFDQDISTAHRMAFAAMRTQATLGEADAIVGVTVTHETVGSDGDLLLVTAMGTAVKLDG